MNEWIIIIHALFVITVFLTILDFYPQLHSFWFFTIPSYYIFLVGLFGLNSLAAYLLKTTIYKGGDVVAILVLSSFGTLSALQSFTLQFADWRIVDLSELINGFKDTVLRDAREKASDREISDIQRTGKKLSEKSANEEELELELELLLGQKRSPTQKKQLVADIKDDAEEKGLDLKRLLADRIAQMDIKRAKQLVKDCEDRKS